MLGSPTGLIVRLRVRFGHSAMSAQCPICLKAQRWPMRLATIMRRAGELLRVIAKHLLDGSDPGRQTDCAYAAARAP